MAPPNRPNKRVLGKTLSELIEEDEQQYQGVEPVELPGPTEREYLDQVTPDDDYRLYGQGPGRSTRVQMHYFEPNYLISDYEKARQGREPTVIKGTVYIQFWKKNSFYAYTNVPKDIYDAFDRSTSKGKFINTTLNQYNYFKIDSSGRSERGKYSGTDELARYFEGDYASKERMFNMPLIRPTGDE